MSATRKGIDFGRYLLLKPIGRGGMAEIWRAKLLGANDFQRDVVVKRILPHLCANPELGRMLTVEARLCARLSHPNIVQVFEFSSVGSELFLAMEYVPGINLHQLLGRLGPPTPVPVGMAVQIVRDVCRALAYAHAALDDDGQPMRIIHRDVSPSNVMLTVDGAVKLLDFGIAKVLSSTDDETRTGVLKGKLGYLSPEAATGEQEIDHRTDLFGAGVVLYELLTGERLFKGRDDLNTLALVRRCEVPPLTREDVPPVLAKICARALERDRERRFATADELVAALTDVLHTARWDESASAAFLRAHGVRAEIDAPTEVPTTADALAPTLVAPRRRVIWPWVAALVPLLVLATVALRPVRRAPPPVAAPPPAPMTAPPPVPPNDPPVPTEASAPRPPKHPRLRHASKPPHATAKRGPDLLKGDVDQDFDP